MFSYILWTCLALRFYFNYRIDHFKISTNPCLPNLVQDSPKMGQDGPNMPRRFSRFCEDPKWPAFNMDAIKLKIKEIWAWPAEAPKLSISNYVVIRKPGKSGPAQPKLRRGLFLNSVL